ncbi:hypothetical protein [Verrucomicrobium sp. GAS474]|uniref:hypothetical protein n=1 Tax=Verrucomicrobium sp. GAS474 TaxID=1882831 RepID=UPI0012FFCB42|nr:hypothetical protein [Verrucomicrobium sp. GAS474]
MWPFASSRRLIETERESVLATIVFCDLKRFTQVAELLSTKQLVDKLDAYLSAIANTLKSYFRKLTKDAPINPDNAAML